MGQWKLLNFTDEESIYATGEVFSRYKWRKKVLERDRNTCQICRNMLRDIYTATQFRNEVHHIYPRRFGGKNTLKKWHNAL